jgi:hypothetical protein
MPNNGHGYMTQVGKTLFRITAPSCLTFFNIVDLLCDCGCLRGKLEVAPLIWLS